MFDTVGLISHRYGGRVVGQGRQEDMGRQTDKRNSLCSLPSSLCIDFILSSIVYHLQSTQSLQSATCMWDDLGFYAIRSDLFMLNDNFCLNKGKTLMFSLFILMLYINL